MAREHGWGYITRHGIKGSTLGCLRGMEKGKNEGEDAGKMGGKEERQ
jgi:hypothetical protein